jgi:hypothetical protein
MKNALDSTVTASRPVSADLKLVVLGVGAVLLVPLVAMQFTHEVNWTAFDFAVAAVLLLAAGSSYVAISRQVKPQRKRTLAKIALVLGFLLLWAELAVGVFNSPIAGS